MRVNFRHGKQRKFLQTVVENLNSPSLRGLIQFGFNVQYSALKNYHNETRLLPEKLFKDMCNLANINANTLKIKLIDENWGKVKGGKSKK